MREAKSKGATTLAIVTVVGSTIAKEVGFCYFTAAKFEFAVATTKMLSAQLAVLYTLAMKFAVRLEKISAKETQALLDEMNVLGGGGGGGGGGAGLAYLLGEICTLCEQGVSVTPVNLKISDKTCLCLPYHVLQDIWEECQLGNRKYGSTRREISPAYGAGQGCGT